MSIKMRVNRKLALEAVAVGVAVAFFILLSVVVPSIVLGYDRYRTTPEDIQAREFISHGITALAIATIFSLHIAGFLLKSNRVRISSFLVLAGLLVMLAYIFLTRTLIMI
ncbi:MAG: hypothetical protein KAW39_06275 [Thermoplasmata archaeon]|nr:hypothetical protein [Thermoplasmata archaeon]